jgi:hypothetical protein
MLPLAVRNGLFYLEGSLKLGGYHGWYEGPVRFFPLARRA